ncbi:hypothetical protein RP20_CCG013373 [Aedes albopictus]|nr:hypothetical protein RP20_CCG013373 [Aedes albopictus]
MRCLEPVPEELTRVPESLRGFRSEPYVASPSSPNSRGDDDKIQFYVGQNESPQKFKRQPPGRISDDNNGAGLMELMRTKFVSSSATETVQKLRHDAMVLSSGHVWPLAVIELNLFQTCR